MRNVYEMQSRWDLRASREEVWDALAALLDSEDPMAWWPSVRVESYVDDELVVLASSHLGYTLKFRLYDLAQSRPESMTVLSDGDLRGGGTMTFSEVSAASSALNVQWNVSVDRAWMRATSWILRPIFVLGHHLVMNQGEKNFNRWLATRGTGQPRRQ